MHINISNYKLATRIRVSDSCQMVWVIIITQLNCVCFKFDGYRNQSTESADFDKLDGRIVNRGRYFDIKQTWSAWGFFQILIGNNKNILMDKCTLHVSCDRAGYQDRTFWLTDFFIWIRDKKEEIWLSPMTKAPTPTEMSKGQWQHIRRHKKVRLNSGCGPT